MAISVTTRSVAALVMRLGMTAAQSSSQIRPLHHAPACRDTEGWPATPKSRLRQRFATKTNRFVSASWKWTSMALHSTGDDASCPST